jgi:peptide/nickel transport system permease protein
VTLLRIWPCPPSFSPSMRWPAFAPDAGLDPVGAGQEYVLTARAKGASLKRVVFVHILPNIAGTLLTVIALAYASLLEGAVLTETVFAWPGIGRYLTTAMFSGDMPAILGATLVVGSCFVLLNALTDLAAARIHEGQAR